MSPGDLPDMHDLTPSQRFDAFLSNFEGAMDADGIAPSTLQVTYLQQMVYTPPSGPPIVMTFGSDGYLSTLTSGSQSIRYHHDGVGTYGYDIKDPSGGYADYTTILSTQWNDDDYILSSTWHPTGETTTYDPPPASTPMPPDNSGGGGGTPPPGGGSSPVGGSAFDRKGDASPFGLAPYVVTEVSQTQQAKADFNDRERTIKNSRKDCNADALNNYWHCLATNGVAITVASGLAGGALGGFLGSLGGPEGAVGGAYTGGLYGVAVGGGAAIAGCVADSIAATNHCTTIYRNATNNNIAQYSADIVRAASNPGSN